MNSFSVYDENGYRRASGFRHAEDAASFVAFLGHGATVRDGRRVLWTEGEEEQSAAESYDFAAGIILGRALP